MDSGVYLIKCSANNAVYVGSSHDLRERRRYHFACLTGGRHQNPRMQSTWNKYGSESFTFEILQPVANAGHLLAVEQSLLDCYRSMHGDRVMNITQYTDAPMRGRKASNETKAKQSTVKTGKRHSDETIMKIVESARCARANPNERTARSLAAIKRWSTDSARASHRTASRNKKIPITGFNDKMGSSMSFESMAAAQAAGFSRGRIKRAINTTALVQGLRWCTSESK